MELVTGKALAADLGVTPMAVTLARQKGRISFADAERRLYDRAGARAQWEQNRERIQAMPAASPTASTLLAGARLRRELVEAALAERRLQEAEGELCRVAGVRSTVSGFVTTLARGLTDMPHRLSPELVGKTQAEIFHALDAWQRSCRSQVVADCRRLWGVDLSHE